MFRFEKLAVWNKALEFADSVYKATGSFPPEERFGLTNQLRRAAVSISSNIAEGSGRNSDADFMRFNSIAYGSLMECISQLHIARRLQFINETGFEQLIMQAEELSRMLSGLSASLRQHD
jgi:four helix bundle protein